MIAKVVEQNRETVTTHTGGLVGDWQAVAQTVNQRMQEIALSQVELSHTSGVSVATLRKVQRGVTQERSDAILSAISRALGFPDDHLRHVANGNSHTAVTTSVSDDALTELRAELADLRRRVESIEERFRQ